MDTDVGAGHAARVFENHETVSNWHAAAELASFSFYEASNGTERWAGGFAGDGSLVEVISLLDGDEVSVQSSCPAPGLPRHTRRRVAVHDLLWSHVLGGDGDLDLPYSVTIEADDRAVSVDGEVHGGVRLGVGTAVHDDDELLAAWADRLLGPHGEATAAQVFAAPRLVPLDAVLAVTA